MNTTKRQKAVRKSYIKFVNLNLLKIISSVNLIYKILIIKNKKIKSIKNESTKVWKEYKKIWKLKLIKIKYTFWQ